MEGAEDDCGCARVHWQLDDIPRPRRRATGATSLHVVEVQHPISRSVDPEPETGIAGGDILGADPPSEPHRAAGRDVRRRSEEHTSELQSQSNLVCRLLLEK